MSIVIITCEFIAICKGSGWKLVGKLRFITVDYTSCCYFIILVRKTFPVVYITSMGYHENMVIHRDKM